jgi:signal peptidase I
MDMSENGDVESRATPGRATKTLRSTWEMTKSLGAAILFVLALRFFVLEPFKIPSGSMIPTLKIGDHIFVTRFSYGLEIGFRDHRWKFAPFAKPHRGDVIVFIYPQDPSLHYIKRVIGLPGDRIAVKDTVVWVNGEPAKLEPVSDRSLLEGHGDEHSDLSGAELYREYLPGVKEPHYVAMDPFNRAPLGINVYYREIEVPEDSYFVMGDNRDHSMDSRSWGFVPYNLIKGKAQIVWLSLDWADPTARLGENIVVPSVRWSRWFNLIH